MGLSQPGLHSELQMSLNYMARPYLKKPKQINNKNNNKNQLHECRFADLT